MNIEEEIFQRSIIDYDKLIPYGFQKTDTRYVLSKNILDDVFRVDVEITEEGIVRGKIIDLSFHEEYTNYRLENQMGEFVSKIRDEFVSVLLDIKNHCTSTSYFMTKQANRITELLIEKYQDIPEFVWDKFPGYGVFKNSKNDKWYGLIMNINKSKIDEGCKEVEILNVKLDKDKIKPLLERKGFYPAYHMNKENWISILLDDTIRDEEIMTYVEESHQFTEVVDEWIVPANPKYYDIIHCFQDTDTILWKQSNHIHVGDLIYLYVAVPYSAILYKCEVVEVDIPYEYKDDNLSMSKVMKIKLLEEFDKDKYTFEVLNQYGIRAIRGPRSMPKELRNEMNGRK